LENEYKVYIVSCTRNAQAMAQCCALALVSDKQGVFCAYTMVT